MRKIQHASEVGMRIQKTADQDKSIIVFKKKVSPELEADVAEVRRILGLDPEAQEFTVVYGSVAK